MDFTGSPGTMETAMTKMLALMVVGLGCGFAEAVDQAIDRANEVLWRDFVSPQGILYDYVGELPTPRDCAEGRPNALGWWSPIENGPMFTGQYLLALVMRAKRTGEPTTRERCRKLAEGLLLCASVSDVPGMVCRGVGSDGKCHYPLGSTDQTAPWFLGLDAYLQSGFAETDLQRRIRRKMAEWGDIYERNGWRFPCDGRFRGEHRGTVRGLPFQGSSPSYLFMLNALWRATDDGKWKRRYLAATFERQPQTELTRIEVCERGYPIDRELRNFKMEPHLLWIYTHQVASLAILAEREDRPEVAARYRRGVEACADAARRFMAAHTNYSNVAERPFKYANWRTGYAWREQATQEDAEQVANTAKREILGTRKDYERDTMTNPLAAALMCAAARKHGDEVARVLRHYDYSTPAISEFFLAPLAYEFTRLPPPRR